MKKRRWRRIADERVRHRWNLECGCPVDHTVWVGPISSTDEVPICEECGRDRIYVETQVLK
jgi:hypothetical protein